MSFSSGTPLDRSDALVMHVESQSAHAQEFFRLCYSAMRQVRCELELFPHSAMAEAGSEREEVPPPSQVEETDELSEQEKKKRSLEVTPEMFADQPGAKRRAEQELAYQTLKGCVVELRVATNAVKDVVRVVQQQHHRTTKIPGRTP